jgi:hypothetical protein
VTAPTEYKSNDMKDSLHKEVECILDQFPKYSMKTLLRDFNAKLGTEGILKSAIVNGSLHEISNDNGVR